MSLLEVRGIDKRFDGVHALRGVTLSIESGEVHALMGENGAGKSTLSKVIAGVVAPDAGEMLLDGRPAAIHNPLDAQRLGIGIIFQELDLFPSLTVAENIAIGNVRVETGALARPGETARFCAPFLQQVGLSCTPNVLLDDLPIGQMQRVAIARALAMDARILLMDEPTSSLGEDDVERLFGLIRDLKSRGVAIVYVSHKMDEVFAIADRVTVMRDGQVIGTRPVSETNVDEVITMMVGRELKDLTRAPSHRTDRVALKVRGLSTAKVSDISFDLHEGEVLGIAGLVGSGRSEVGAALFGLDRRTSGHVELGGREIAPTSPSAAMEAGIGLLPEDRKFQGLMMQMSVRENTTIGVLSRWARGGIVSSSAESRDAGQVLALTRVKAASPEALISSLSGGNQQKVLFSRWLMADPAVLFLDDPTRGVDVGAKQEIHSLIADLASRGKAILMVSSELPELLRCCDRILVLHEGRCTGIVDASSATQEQIMSLATASGAGAHTA
jgi:ABC-type sugar transport system ATPase subunit